MIGDRVCRIVSPAGCLGYGVHASSLARAMDLQPDAIGADCGSTDSGPYYLGAGARYQSEAMMRRDLRLLLHAARTAQIPLLIGSAGNAGAQPHVEWIRGLIEELA